MCPTPPPETARLAARQTNLNRELRSLLSCLRSKSGLAPEDRQGEYLGAFAMGTRIYDSLGPILVTSLILGLGQLGWALLGLMYAGLALSLSAAAHWASRALPSST